MHLYPRKSMITCHHQTKRLPEEEEEEEALELRVSFEIDLDCDLDCDEDEGDAASPPAPLSVQVEPIAAQQRMTQAAVANDMMAMLNNTGFFVGGTCRHASHFPSIEERREHHSFRVQEEQPQRQVVAE